MRITEYTTASYYETWGFCLWGSPKIKIVCGECNALYSTRDYVKVTNMHNQIAAFCPYCRKWNLLKGLVSND